MIGCNKVRVGTESAGVSRGSERTIKPSDGMERRRERGTTRWLGEQYHWFVFWGLVLQCKAGLRHSRKRAIGAYAPASADPHSCRLGLGILPRTPPCHRSQHRASSWVRDFQTSKFSLCENNRLHNQLAAGAVSAGVSGGSERTIKPSDGMERRRERGTNRWRGVTWQMHFFTSLKTVVGGLSGHNQPGNKQPVDQCADIDRTGQAKKVGGKDARYW